MCILTEILSGAHAKGAIFFNDFKFATFVGRYPSDGAANMAVKRLMEVDSTGEMSQKHNKDLNRL